MTSVKILYYNLGINKNENYRRKDEYLYYVQ